MAEQIIAGLAIAIVMFIVGSLWQKRTDNKKRKKDFYLEDYKDLWKVIQNVHGVIQRNRIVRHEKVMKSIQEKYSCKDIHMYLKKLVRTDDDQLKDLLERFSENLLKYEGESGRLKFSDMGDGETDCKAISNKITNSIRNRIDRYLTI